MRETPKFKVWENRPGKWKYQIEGRPESVTYYSSSEVATIVATDEVWRLRFGKGHSNTEKIVARRNKDAAEWQGVVLTGMPDPR